MALSAENGQRSPVNVVDTVRVLRLDPGIDVEPLSRAPLLLFGLQNFECADGFESVFEDAPGCGTGVPSHVFQPDAADLTRYDDTTRAMVAPGVSLMTRSSQRCST